MTLRKAAEQALAAIKSANQVNYSWACVEAVAALEAALAEEALQRLTDVQQNIEAALAEPQDPVAYDGWVLREVLFDNGEPVGHRAPEQEPVGTARELFTNTTLERLDIRPSTKVYLDAPPQRKPLSDEMQKQMKEQRCDSMEMRSAFIDGWLSAEAAHGIGEKHE